MKKSKFLIIAATCAAASAFTGCTDVMEESVSHDSSSISDGITYPNSPDFIKTLSRADKTFETDWQDYEYVEISGKKLWLPWAMDSNGSADKDIRKEDGWKMVLHNFKMVDNIDNKTVDIIFYNEYSGEMKICYHIPEKPNQTTETLPTISFSKSTTLLNACEGVATPSCYTIPNFKYAVTPHSRNYLTKNWNIVSVPLNYDPNTPAEMQLIFDPSKGITSAALNFIIEAQSQSEGTLTSISYKDSKIHSMVNKVAGDNAKKLAAKIIPQDKNFSEILTGGVAGLIKAGVNLLSSKFFGKTKDVEESTIQFTTQTTGSAEGSLYGSTTTGLSELNREIGKTRTNIELGNWTLTEMPTLYMHPVGILSLAKFGPMGDYFLYDFRSSGNYKYNVVINPTLKSKLKKYWTECVTVMESHSAIDTIGMALPSSSYAYSDSDFGSLGNHDRRNLLDAPSELKTYLGTVAKCSYTKTPFVEFKNVNGIYAKYGRQEGTNPTYRFVYAPNNADIMPAGQKFSMSNVYLKISLYMIVDNNGSNDTIVTTRTYYPKFEWDPSLMSKYNYGNSMSQVQTMASQDALLLEIDPKVWETLDMGPRPNSTEDTE